MNMLVDINKRGALTLPKEIRRKYGLEQGGQVIIQATEDGILLMPGAAFPIEIYTPGRLKEFAEEEQKLARYKLK
jgi:AbrB family looped-hinge helix DNA binding protein